MLPTEELVVAEALQQLRRDNASGHNSYQKACSSPPSTSAGSKADADMKPRITESNTGILPLKGVPHHPTATPHPLGNGSGFSAGSDPLSPVPSAGTGLPPALPPISSMSLGAAPGAPSDQHPGSQSTSQLGMWQGMLLSATSLLLPAETQNRLRCLVRMLRLATDHLSDRVASLKEAMDQESAGVKPEFSVNALRADIVTTVRKSTNVITTFASSSLPERARVAVRSCVLALPSQWASHMDLAGNAAGSPGVSGISAAASNGAGPASESAVLSLANESLVMIRNVIAIVDETLYRAESWCQLLGKRSRGEETDEDVEKERGAFRQELGIEPLPRLSSDSVQSTSALSQPMTPMMGTESETPVTIGSGSVGIAS